MITKPETTPQSDMTDAVMSGAKSDEIERLRARIAELEAGLKPFAENAEHWPDEWDDAANNFTIVAFILTAGDFRRARALLKGADE